MTAAEREGLRRRLTPAQMRLFDSMPIADQRHGLDVAAELGRRGATEPELLVAGLLHDAGKGRSVRLPHRVTWSLGEAFGPGVVGVARLVPGFRAPLDRIRDHPELSARLAAEAGCSERIVELIRHQDAPADTTGQLLHEADEAC